MIISQISRPLSSTYKSLHFPVENKTPTTTYFIILIVLLSLFQNLLSTLVSPYNQDIAKGILILKEVGYSVLIALTIGATQKLQKLTFLSLITISAIVAHYLLLGVLLESFRQAIMLPFVICAGAAGKRFLRENTLEKVVRRTFILIIILAFLEYILATPSELLLNTIGFSSFVKMKGFDKWMSSSGVLASFYSWDLMALTGSSVRRMAGLNFIDPVVLGQFMAFPALYFFASKRYFLFTLSISVIVLSISKGGALAFVLGVVLLTINSQKLKRYYFLKRLIYIIVLTSAVLTIYSALTIQSVSNHVGGLVSGLTTMFSSPIGLGLGNAGNYSELYLDSGSGIGESFFGSLIAQIGIFTFSIYALCLYTLNKIDSQQPFWIAVKYSGQAMLICSLISESAITYSGTAIIFFFAALYSPQKVTQTTKSPSI